MASSNTKLLNFVFNKTLDWLSKTDEWTRFKNKVQLCKTCCFLPQWKKEFEWLKKCHGQVFATVSQRCWKSLSLFFSRRVDFPNVKNGKDSFRYPQGWFEFRRQRDYKVVWLGSYLGTVNLKDMSRTSACCGAMNILGVWHAQLACKVS